MTTTTTWKDHRWRRCSLSFLMWTARAVVYAPKATLAMSVVMPDQRASQKRWWSLEMPENKGHRHHLHR